MRIFAIWIKAVLLRQSKNHLALPKVQDLKELKITLAARFEEWAHQHKQKGLETGMANGIAKGRKQGEACILQRLLVARFGPLSQETLTRLEQASTAELEAWTDRFLTARSKVDIFTAP